MIMKEEAKILQTDESYVSPEIKVIPIEFEQNILGGSGEPDDLWGTDW